MLRLQTTELRAVGHLGITKAFLFLAKSKVLAALRAVYLPLTRLLSQSGWAGPIDARGKSGT